MRPYQLASAVLWVGLLAGPAWASEGDTVKPDAPPAQGGQTSQQQPPPITGLTPEFAAALAPAGAKSPADREDRATLAKFYESRQYEPVWLTATGVTPAASKIIAEFAKADDWGLEASAFRLPPMPAGGTELSRSQRANLDVAISLAVLKYARHARGGRVDPTALSKFIDRKPPLADPARVIEGIAKADEPDAYLRGLHPQHVQFERLRQKYLAAKGTATPEAGSNAKRLLLNMEAWRWMPESLGDFYVWVNIPEFVIRVVSGGKVIHTERVVVGKNDTQTPVFSDQMEQIIFHPFWGIPDSIKQADILPTLLRGSTKMMERYNLRIQSGGKDIEPLSVDWTKSDIRKFHVYQPPGDTNLLGVVKFRFPNKHDVYMHDTPQKQLFNATVRAYSHGCMRVRNPQKLAELLLAEDQGWPAQKVAAAVAVGATPNNQINLKRHIPVHITYFTAAVEDDGKLVTFADIYSHESKIALGLEGKVHLIPRWKEDKKPIDVVGSLKEIGTEPLKQSWQRKIFEN